MTGLLPDDEHVDLDHFPADIKVQLVHGQHWERVLEMQILHLLGEDYEDTHPGQQWPNFAMEQVHAYPMAVWNVRLYGQCKFPWLLSLVFATYPGLLALCTQDDNMFRAWLVQDNMVDGKSPNKWPYIFFVMYSSINSDSSISPGGLGSIWKGLEEKSTKCMVDIWQCRPLTEAIHQLLSMPFLRDCKSVFHVEVWTCGEMHQVSKYT